jgi:osmotically-inducible protein OsmY
MYARAVDDAGARLRELREEEWEDLGLGALALGLALGSDAAKSRLLNPTLPPELLRSRVRRIRSGFGPCRDALGPKWREHREASNGKETADESQGTDERGRGRDRDASLAQVCGCDPRRAQDLRVAGDQRAAGRARRRLGAREIREDVFRDTLWIEDGKLDVKVERGEVTLAGQVERRSDADVLSRFVARVPGMISVRSTITWEWDDRKAEQRSDPRVPIPPRRT